MSTNHNLFEEKGEPKRYATEVLSLTTEPNGLPLGQTGSPCESGRQIQGVMNFKADSWPRPLCAAACLSPQCSHLSPHSPDEPDFHAGLYLIGRHLGLPAFGRAAVIRFEMLMRQMLCTYLADNCSLGPTTRREDNWIFAPSLFHRPTSNRLSVYIHWGFDRAGCLEGR